MRSSRQKTAFTLVELLVVIGIIALLISILLPVLGKARRAADSARCLANLQQIGSSAALYRNDTGRCALFWSLRTSADASVPLNSIGTFLSYTVFNFGGKATNDGINWCFMPEQDKPLTAVTDRTVGPADPFTGTRTPAATRAQREVFHCPGDNGGMGENGMADFLTDGVPSPYESFGTSYVANRFWFYDPSMDLPMSQMLGSPWTPANIDRANSAMSKTIFKWNASRTVFCSDIWFLLSLWNESPWQGVHSSNSMHNVLFFDGHAETIQLGADDTKHVTSSGRLLFHGTNWSTYDDQHAGAFPKQLIQSYAWVSNGSLNGGLGSLPSFPRKAPGYTTPQ